MPTYWLAYGVSLEKPPGRTLLLGLEEMSYAKLSNSLRLVVTYFCKCYIYFFCMDFYRNASWSDALRKEWIYSLYSLGLITYVILWRKICKKMVKLNIKLILTSYCGYWFYISEDKYRQTILSLIPASSIYLFYVSDQSGNELIIDDWPTLFIRSIGIFLFFPDVLIPISGCLGSLNLNR